MASSVSMMLSGSEIFTTMPDILFIPEFVCNQQDQIIHSITILITT